MQQYYKLLFIHLEAWSMTGPWGCYALKSSQGNPNISHAQRVNFTERNINFNLSHDGQLSHKSVNSGPASKAIHTQPTSPMLSTCSVKRVSKSMWRVRIAIGDLAKWGRTVQLNLTCPRPNICHLRPNLVHICPIINQ